MKALPGEFLSRMQAELKGDYAAFLESYNNESVRGLRANTLKGNADAIAALCPVKLERVDNTADGFRLTEAWEGVGLSPVHMAGLIYMQEPSAMLTIAIADIHPGMKVLDMCAAPGGKTGAAAARLNGQGLIVSNEIVPSRAKILESTVERMGIANAAVISRRPDEIAKAMPEYFDRVIVDAPCSGEGMFRKDERAIEEWSAEHVSSCANRQRLILESSAQCVAKDGMLIYSTCTFSREENEDNIEWFLKTHTDFELAEQRRLYPHTFAGEGHFAAVLRRKGGSVRPYAPLKLTPCKDKAYAEFIKDTFTVPPKGTAYAYQNGVNIISAELPEAIAPMLRRSVGVYAGELQKGRFVPHHTLVMAEHGGEYARMLSLDESDARLAAYMRGEEINCPEAWRGYCAVAYRNHPIGWGKAVGGRMKNHLPKGLRAW